MKPAAWIPGIALALAIGAGPHAVRAQLVNPQAPSSVSYLNPGRYFIFQGNYVNDKGDLESGLVKFDSQTGLTWLLQPAPATNGAAAGFGWVPVKN